MGALQAILWYNHLPAGGPAGRGGGGQLGPMDYASLHGGCPVHPAGGGGGPDMWGEEEDGGGGGGGGETKWAANHWIEAADDPVRFITLSLCRHSCEQMAITHPQWPSTMAITIANRTRGRVAARARVGLGRSELCPPLLISLPTQADDLALHAKRQGAAATAPPFGGKKGRPRKKSGRQKARKDL